MDQRIRRRDPPGRGPLAGTVLRRRPLDGLTVDLPSRAKGAAEAAAFAEVPEAFALPLLRSEALFRREQTLTGGDLAAAMRRVDRVAACWRQALTIWHVYLFLKWNDTAPKGRLLIHHCKEMGIAY